MNEKQIVKQYGECEVTITFSEHNSDLRDNVLWLMTENYLDRIKAEISSDIEKLSA